MNVNILGYLIYLWETSILLLSLGLIFILFLLIFGSFILAKPYFIY